LANALFDVILPSLLGSSLWSFGQRFPIKYLLNSSGIWHSLHVTKPAESLSFYIINYISMFLSIYLFIHNFNSPYLIFFCGPEYSS
jgi:hypothetical protein